MAITFPASPTNGQTFTSGNKTWQWDGTTWLAYGASLSPTVLKVDAANARVGINNQSPAYALDVNGTIEGTQFLQGTDYLSPYQGFRNHLINGGFDVWQRGTSIAGLNNATSYAADRWVIFRSLAANYTLSRFAVSPSELTGFNYCARYQRSAGDTSTQPLYLGRTFESISIIPLAGKTVTYSFYARKGANYSGGNLNLTTEFGTGTDLPFLTQPTSPSITNMTSALTASWQRFQTTFTVPTTATAARIFFNTSPTGTAGANDYFEITGVQLEIGSVATPFEQRPIQTELALCQRYCISAKTDYSIINGFTTTTSQKWFSVQLPTTMRIAPNFTVYDSAGNAGKIGTLNAAGTGTNNITPSYLQSFPNLITVLISGTNTGMYFGYFVECEL